MTFTEAQSQQTEWITLGNQSAGEFLWLWDAYVHAIDDLVDGDRVGSESLLDVFAQAIFVYTHPFFMANMVALRQIAINCTNAYADAAAWEKLDGWKLNFSDHYRHFAVEMVIAIASICGGYAHARRVSPALRELCWNQHHNEKGEIT